ncbi:SapC family protein [Bosea sp. F3-2]|uniref:SapC family protein n=1 Tax=Bosea sp. F3-2 TaxID=2599640 RepID=UPI0020C07565|nr:SapC family protein [Bosea sp. F3-2]
MPLSASGKGATSSSNAMGDGARSHVPAYVRRYPFIGSEAPDKAQQLLAIDRKSDRFVASISTRSDAEAPVRRRRQANFDGAGGHGLLPRLPCRCRQHARVRQSAWRGEAAHAEPVQIQFPDGAQQMLNGFCAVDEKAFRALPARTVTDWHAKGWLDLATLHLASLQSFQGLLDLNAQRANERKALA